MAKIAIIQIDKDGWLTGKITPFTNHAEAVKSITTAGTYAFVEVHELQPAKKAKDE